MHSPLCVRNRGKCAHNLKGHRINLDRTEVKKFLKRIDYPHPQYLQSPNFFILPTAVLPLLSAIFPQSPRSSHTGLHTIAHSVCSARRRFELAPPSSQTADSWISTIHTAPFPYFLQGSAPSSCAAKTSFTNLSQIAPTTPHFPLSPYHALFLFFSTHHLQMNSW